MCSEHFRFFVCKVMQPYAWVCSCNGLRGTQIPRAAYSNSMPCTAGTATRLDLHLEGYLCQIGLAVNTSRKLQPGHSCMQAGPALRNFAGEHFPLLTSCPCVFSLLVVLRFGFRLDAHHAHILTLQGFDHHVSGSVHLLFCACSLQTSWLH